MDAQAAAIRAALVGQQLQAPAVAAEAYGQVVAAAVAVIGSLSEQLAALEAARTKASAAHPDSRIVQGQPGLGVVLGARVLAEFGDDPDRYPAKARKAYAGTAPITRASGSRQTVLARAVATGWSASCEVRRDGTAGLVGCMGQAPPKGHRSANEAGRLPRSRLTARQRHHASAILDPAVVRPRSARAQEHQHGPTGTRAGLHERAGHRALRAPGRPQRHRG